MKVLTAFFMIFYIVKGEELFSTFNLINPYEVSVFNHHQSEILPHRDAIETALEESSVPSSLKKSENFYNNPHVADALAKESLTFNKETVIYDRVSDKIDRNQIVKLINNLNRVHYE